MHKGSSKSPGYEVLIIADAAGCSDSSATRRAATGFLLSFLGKKANREILIDPHSTTSEQICQVQKVHDGLVFFFLSEIC